MIKYKQIFVTNRNAYVYMYGFISEIFFHFKETALVPQSPLFLIRFLAFR